MALCMLSRDTLFSIKLSIENYGVYALFKRNIWNFAVAVASLNKLGGDKYLLKKLAVFSSCVFVLSAKCDHDFMSGLFSIGK